jgi:bifunctional DNA-binding transcriptional regulator/antitoxin component of YhaV-PrlF toxin-antitoxin module
VAESLGIKDGDDVDFFQYSGKSFLFAKKADIADLLVRIKQGQPAVTQQIAQPTAPQQPTETATVKGKEITMDAVELALLKKLDTIRYGERTKAKVDGMLGAEEKATLQKLLKKGFVTLFRKSNENEYKYGIERGIYDRFLFGKRTYPNRQGQPAPARTLSSPRGAQFTQRAAPIQMRNAVQDVNEYVSMLESKGYLVLKSEAEAASASAAMEESIRQGLVIGTRGFDKKFYIALRDFINRSAPKMLKIIENKSVSIDDISKETGIDADGARAILNILAENGEVTEVRKDVFRSA